VKRTASAMTHSSESSTQPNLFDDNDSDDEESDDDDSCVKIPLITHIRSAATIHVEGNQSGGSVPSIAEGLSNCDSRGKAIMDDVVDTPSGNADRSSALTGPTLASQDPTSDAINREFYPFSLSPYYVAYREDDVVACSYEIIHEEWEGPH
nr:hypothetical protein [Tanacetum cinerariifolium]